MAEFSITQVIKFLLIIAVAISLILIIYFSRDVLYEKTSMVKDIFSNLFSFS